jgi:hypothetical protein
MEELLNTVSNDIEKTLSSAPDRQKAKVAIRNQWMQMLKDWR